MCSQAKARQLSMIAQSGSGQLRRTFSQLGTGHASSPLPDLVAGIGLKPFWRLNSLLPLPLDFALCVTPIARSLLSAVLRRSLGGFIASGVSLAGLLLDELHDCGLQWDCSPWWIAKQEVGAMC